MRVEYQYIEGFHFNAGAQEVGEELAALGRTATPEEVVSWARAHPESALYVVIFEKTAREAEHEYRLVVARRLLRAVVRIEKSERRPPQRAFVNLEKGTSRYVNTETLTGAERTEYEVRRALEELDSFQRRYRHLKRFRDLLVEIDRLLA